MLLCVVITSIILLSHFPATLLRQSFDRFCGENSVWADDEVPTQKETNRSLHTGAPSPIYHTRVFPEGCPHTLFNFTKTQQRAWAAHSSHTSPVPSLRNRPRLHLPTHDHVRLDRIEEEPRGLRTAPPRISLQPTVTVLSNADQAPPIGKEALRHELCCESL